VKPEIDIEVYSYVSETTNIGAVVGWTKCRSETVNHVSQFNKRQLASVQSRIYDMSERLVARSKATELIIIIVDRTDDNLAMTRISDGICCKCSGRQWCLSRQVKEEYI
jgi:hypothetical protein